MTGKTQKRVQLAPLLLSSFLSSFLSSLPFDEAEDEEEGAALPLPPGILHRSLGSVSRGEVAVQW
jgi:hypothetical protein